MCGASGKLYKTIVEEAELSLCENCNRFGKVVSVVKEDNTNVNSTKVYTEPATEVMDILVDDYAEKIRKKRERLGLNQKEFAKKLNEKESVVQKIESGHFEPSIDLARKIGSFLKIRLIEEYKELHEKQAQTKSENFTIGDIIKTKEK